ncbi:MAG: alanine racemase [Gemmatimonadota bacterium]
MSTDRRTRAWLELEASSLRRNFRRIREAVGASAAIIPMVKANAYGLGVAEVVRFLEGEAPWGFGVATTEEGEELRALGIELPVLVIGPVPPAAYPDLVAAGLTPGISDLGGLRALAAAAARAGRPATFHVEIDTGMGRGGFAWRDARTWGEEVAKLASPGDRLRWSGCFTHFHSADEADDAALLVQRQRFRGALALLPRLGEGALIHACNSAGALRGPAATENAVRPGIFLYGGVAGNTLPAPEPVASLRARVVFVRDAPEGSTVGYGATHTASRPERWATVGIGYGDGLPRALGNRGHALVKGRRVPIIGRISMDLTVVDITDVQGVEPGDVVTFIGSDGSATISVEEVASLASTINYEILTDFTRRLPRIWLEPEDDGPIIHRLRCGTD